MIRCTWETFLRFRQRYSNEFITGQTVWVDGGLFTHPNWPYDVATV